MNVKIIKWNITHNVHVGWVKHKIKFRLVCLYLWVHVFDPFDKVRFPGFAQRLTRWMYEFYWYQFYVVRWMIVGKKMVWKCSGSEGRGGSVYWSLVLIKTVVFSFQTNKQTNWFIIKSHRSKILNCVIIYKLQI